ncbi:MAG TPA: sulfite exporter TauE/SafE family protein [Actinomycetota bacterium]|nr:sulfite exporter TauE/SafE family protein [Actinomycetota bacterium]
MSLELDTVLIMVVAISLGGLVKGVTGQGLPQIAIPVMATFLGVEAAVVIMTVPGIVTNSWLMWKHRHHFPRTRDLPVLLIGGAIGVVAGTILLDSLDDDVLSLTLAAAIIGYAVIFFTHPSLRLEPGVTRYTSGPVGVAAGMLQGATGASGPLLATYLHGYRLDKQVYVISITTIFQVFALVQAVALLGVGLYTTELFFLSLLSLVPIMLMLGVGVRFTDRISRRTFDLIVLAVLLATALKLIYDGLT